MIRLLLPQLLFALLVAIGVRASAVAATQPNIVWIIADDMSPDIATYGAAGVQTPNLDRMAAQGWRYTRAYASAPVCSSSRSAFILGCYQTTTGLHAHDVENPQPLIAPYRPLPELFREAGWFVTNTAAPGAQRNRRAVTQGKTHYNFAHDSAEMFDGDDWRQRKPGQPFFAQFQITEPHRSFPIPERFDEAALASIKLPPNYPDHPLMRRDWYAYLRSVEVVDHRVGAILDQLQEEGVLDDTIVLFFADHGRPMPWGKQWLTVEGLQVPLIVRGPRIGSGEIEERLVSLIDLAPSMLQLAGLPIPAWMEGRALLDVEFPQREVIFAARDRCGDAQDRIRAVIGHDDLLVRNFEYALPHTNWSSYKEEQYPGLPLLRTLYATGQLDRLQSDWMQPTRSEIEFYDLKADPFGVYNRAGDSSHAPRIAAMRSALDSWINHTGDQGALPDPVTEPSLAEIQKAKRAGYQRLWKTRIQKPEPTDSERVAWWEASYHIEGVPN